MTDNEELDVALIERLKELGSDEDSARYLATLDEALARVKTIDNQEPLVKLNNNSLGNRIHIWLVDLEVETTEVERLQLRRTVAEKLKAAADSLPFGYSLIIRDAFRSEKMIWDLFSHYLQRLGDREPELSARERELRVRTLLAMPDDLVPPGHMTGGAVDVNLGDADGCRLDLEVPADQIPRKLQAPTFCSGLPDQLVRRRQLLYRSLTNQGFYNYFREYWHYSYGDAYWAVRRKNKRALYDIPRTPYIGPNSRSFSRN